MTDRPAQHPRPTRDRDRADLAIDAASWLGTLAIFIYGAALSYDVLHAIAPACGLDSVLARLWPLGFETFMAVAASPPPPSAHPARRSGRHGLGQRPIASRA